MMPYSLATRCRASGESLGGAAVLFEVPDAPFPGVYPKSEAESFALRSPLRVVQARQSGLVQLAHVFDAACYEQYRFVGAVSSGYTAYMKAFAQSVTTSFPRDAVIMEVGCGDGTLLAELLKAGFRDLFGIDPGQPAQQRAANLPIAGGYFPADMPMDQCNRKRDLIILRHVLEHLETPTSFVSSVAASLKPEGQLWIEVPDLESTVRREVWSNFYQLHCSYFEAATLDALLAQAGLTCVGGAVVDVFGGSLLRRYSFGSAVAATAPTAWKEIGAQVGKYRHRLHALAAQIPDRCVGYGAAERTAVILGFCPALESKLCYLTDGNPLLTGRFFGGTTLPIAPKDQFFRNPPPSAVVLFAISHVREIIAEFQMHLPDTVMIGVAGADFSCQSLAEWLRA